MPRYVCPILTCNVAFEGSMWDVTPQAISHGEGSHKMYLSDEQVAVITERQARGESVDEFLPKEKVILPEPKPIVGYLKTQQHAWWKK